MLKKKILSLLRKFWFYFSEAPFELTELISPDLIRLEAEQIHYMNLVAS